MPSPAQLRELVERTVDLPAMPVVGARIVAHLHDPSCCADSIAKLIQVDPALAAKLLSLANSTAFAGVTRSISIQQAVVRIGLQATSSLALALSSRAVLKTFGKVERELWGHSVACAAAAQEIAIVLAPATQAEAFTAGLLHDVGKYVLATTHPVRFSEARRQSASGGEAGCLAELGVFGITHADVGAVLMQSWGLPSSLFAVAGMHHDLPLAHSTAGGAARLVEIVALADAIVHAAEEPAEQAQMRIDEVRGELEILKVDEECVTMLRERLKVAVREQQALLAA